MMAATIDKALQQLVAMTKGVKQYVELWKNASPTSNFAAQTISLNLSDYDGVRIVWKPSTTGGERIITDGVIGNDYLFNFIANGNASAIAELRTRKVTISTTGCSFTAGYGKTITVTSAGTQAGYCIPVSIYGIKTLNGGGTA
jgi:hypothetical protein